MAMCGSLLKRSVTDLNCNGQSVDDKGGLDGAGYVAESLGQVSTTNEDVPLQGQGHGQPQGRRVEDGRQVVRQENVGQAPFVRHPVVATAEGEEDDKGRKGHHPRQGVGNCHGNEDDVRGAAHRPLDENEARQTVRHHGYGHDGRDHVTVDGNGVRGGVLEEQEVG